MSAIERLGRRMRRLEANLREQTKKAIRKSETEGGMAKEEFAILNGTNAIAPSITCPKCGRASYHPEDIKHRYCGNCHEYHHR
jgi:ribosomal protein S27AE